MIWLVWTAGAVARAVANIGVSDGNGGVIVAFLIGLVMTPVAIIATRADRRVPVQYAQRTKGRKMMGSGPSPYISIPAHLYLVQAAGTWSLLVGLSAILSLLDLSNPVTELRASGWFSLWGVFVGATWMVVGLLMAIYVNPAIDVEREANLLRQKGGFIPDVRPGPQTEWYLKYVRSRFAIGTVPFLFIGVYVLPMVLADALIGADSGFDLLATSFPPAALIVIGQWKAIHAELVLANYEGFLR